MCKPYQLKKLTDQKTNAKPNKAKITLNIDPRDSSSNVKFSLKPGLIVIDSSVSSSVRSALKPFPTLNL